MGNDGGSIPTRRELVKEAARNPTVTELKATQTEQQEHAWSTDPLTQKPLARPVVSDSGGRLYNKDSVLEFLLGEDAERKAEREKVVQGKISGLKDVVEVKFEVEKGEEGRNKTGAGRESWVCPVTNKTLGPGAKAVYLVPCGHALAGSVIKEVSKEEGENLCLVCNEAYAPNDVIPILPTDPVDIARLELRMKTLKEKGLTHSLKKAPGGKKRKKNGDKDAANGDTAKGSEAEAEAKPRKSASGSSTPQPSSGIKNAATASLTQKVLEEQEARNKRRKLETNENLKSLFSSSNQDPAAGKNTDFMTRGYNIPANARR